MSRLTDPDHTRSMIALRAAWFALALVMLFFIAIGAPAFYETLQVVCTDACTGPEPSAERLQSLVAYGLSPRFYAGYITALDVLLSLAFITTSALIFWRKSGDRMALFAAFTLLLLAATAGNSATHAGRLPQLTTIATFFIWLGSSLFVVFFAGFPSGRFIPRWTVWVVVAWVLWDFTEHFLLPLETAVSPLLAIFFFLVLVQLYRFRYVSNWEQRQRTKWVVFGFAVGIGIFVSGYIITPAFGLYRPDDALNYLVLDTFIYICFLCLPISICLAVLRSNLWGINLIIRKTLVYGAVTGLLGMLYFGSIVLLQALFGSMAEARSPAVIVLSTLLISALFQPLRGRIQIAIDRRFFRQKYDAQQVLAHFATSAREEMALEALTADLVQTIQGVLQPDLISVWLLPTDRQVNL